MVAVECIVVLEVCECKQAQVGQRGIVIGGRYWAGELHRDK